MVESVRSAEKISTTEAVYRIMDETQAAAFSRSTLKLACSNQCAQCCHLLVALSGTEAEAIREYLLSRPMLFSRLRERIQQTISAWHSYTDNHPNPAEVSQGVGIAADWIGKPCMFLDRERQECEIYHIRPLACRSYGSPVRCTSPQQPEATAYTNQFGPLLYAIMLEDEESSPEGVTISPLPLWMASKLKDRL